VTISTPSAQEVLVFWFGEAGAPDHGLPREKWFLKNIAFDREIADRFRPLIESALAGELDAWASLPDSGLAQIIVLDQFTRNVFRDSPRAFAGDARALAAARAMVAAHHDELLLPVQRGFVYMPFVHAEDRQAQAEGVQRFRDAAVSAPQMQDSLDWALRHQLVIDRFGRFPHRNEVLGRASTPEELAFLEQPGSRF
jgi:uncharacterized protein (DUF924 family)